MKERFRHDPDSITPVRCMNLKKCDASARVRPPHLYERATLLRSDRERVKSWVCYGREKKRDVEKKSKVKAVRPDIGPESGSFQQRETSKSDESDRVIGLSFVILRSERAS